MTNKCIVWRTSDGRVWITYPNDSQHEGSMPRLKSESEEAYLDRVAAHFLAAIDDVKSSVREALLRGEDAAFPPELTRMPNIPINDLFLQDRMFRDAWEHDGRDIKVNLEKAKSIRYQQLIGMRDAKLRSVRNAASRNRLKNIDEELAAAVEAVQTVEALKNITHPDLED